MPGNDEESGGESQTTFYIATGALVLGGAAFFWNDRNIKSLRDDTEKRFTHILNHADSKFLQTGNLFREHNNLINEQADEIASLRRMVERLAKRVKQLERNLGNKGKERNASYADKESSSDSEDESSAESRKRNKRRDNRRKNVHDTGNQSHDFEKLLNLATRH